VHGDSRLYSCKPRFDGCELDSTHVMVDLVAGSSNRWQHSLNRWR
jgi:hypothetical protein